MPPSASTSDQEQQAQHARIGSSQAREAHLARLQGLEAGHDIGGPEFDPVDEHLKTVQGLFIAGGQDRPVSPTERDSRETYDQHLIRIARNRGIPTLAVCGGSRCLARGFGGAEQHLSAEEQKIHQPRDGLNVRAHPIRFTGPSTILSGAAPFDPSLHTGRSEADRATGRFPSHARDASLGIPPTGDRESLLSSIDAVNSTHEKVAAHDPGGIIHSNLLPTGERELVTSALSTDPEPHPEGFETRHGAPIVVLRRTPRRLRAPAASRGVPRQSRHKHFPITSSGTSRRR